MEGRVYVGALDGYLYALDADTGASIWRADTLIGREKHVPYTLTGAPVVTRDSVVIGNAGADYPGYAGTSPHSISIPAAQMAVLYRAAQSGTRCAGSAASCGSREVLGSTAPLGSRRRWAVWDGLTYDPKTTWYFLGTANVSPYNTREDGRKGGDELYACS